MSESKEIVIDEKLMKIGKPGLPGGFHINNAAELEPIDPIADQYPNNHRHAAQCHVVHLDTCRRDSDTSTCLSSGDQSKYEGDLPEKQDNEGTKLWKVKHIVKLSLIILLVAAYNAYIGYALHYHITTGRDIDWCGGLGFLIILTAIVYIFLLYFHIIKKIVPWRKVGSLIPKRLIRFVSSTPGKCFLSIFVLVCIAIFLIIDTVDDRQRLVSAGGIFSILLLGYIFSTSRSDIVWRHVVWGLALQFIFGLLILRWSYGKMFFDCIGDKVGQQL